tara:strand:- start:10927 stop:12060 length:1134 start_codon:yes stop_codon:yes gene_type:complete
MKTKYFLLLIFCFNSIFFFSQEKIFGVVLDENTKEPIPGVYVYYENKSIGTTSDIDGEFSLKYNSKITTPIVFSFIGYTTLKISSIEIVPNKKITIYLKENTEVLEEVVIDHSGMKWQTKFNEFKKHYLGLTDNGKSCNIKNPQDLLLTYNPKEKKLVAKAKAPIIIENNKLKYLITVNDLYFQATYRFVAKNHSSFDIQSTFYNGSAFYKDLANLTDVVTQETRLKTYQGSILHFMRSLARLKLTEEGFSVHILKKKIIKQSDISKKIIKRADISKKITVDPIKNGVVLISFPKPLLAIFHNKNSNSFDGSFENYSNFDDSSEDMIENYSFIESLVYYFSIDSFGNYSSKDKIIFSGLMGKTRVGDALPLDYLMEE